MLLKRAKHAGSDRRLIAEHDDRGAVLRFSGGRLALIDTSFRAAFTQQYEVLGTSGRIIVPRAFRPDSLPGRIQIEDAEGRWRTEDIPSTNQYAAQADHVARSVRDGRLLPPAEDGVAQARAIEALHASAARGSAVSVR